MDLDPTTSQDSQLRAGVIHFQSKDLPGTGEITENQVATTMFSVVKLRNSAKN